VPSETGSKGSLALKPSQRRYAAAGSALFSPTLLSVSLTVCRSPDGAVAQLPALPLAKFRAVPVAVPHCCGGRQRLGTGDVAPVSPAQVQKTSASLVLQPICLRARTAQALQLVVRASFQLHTERPVELALLGFFVAGLRLWFVSVLHQSDRPSFTSRGITAALLSRPSQSDSRVVAHNERVVGNGCHTAGSTRTSLGVPALQGFTSSILHVRFYAYRQTCAWLRISPVLPSHA
jgi:hypothetical protein